MPTEPENEVVHLKAGENLPAVPAPTPTTEMLKQLLEQMLENERRRLRNEYVRITMLFLLLLALAIGGGLWFAGRLFDQLRQERQTAERSLYALIQRVAPETPAPDALIRDQRSEVRGQRTEVSHRSALDIPAQAADTNTVKAQADIQRLLTDLELKNRTLTELLKNQNAQTKSVLKSRDGELQLLHEHMKEVQRKIMNAAPPEALPAKEVKAPPAIAAESVESLTVMISNAVPLRLPIPAP